MNLHPIHLNNFGSNAGPAVVTGRMGSTGIPMFTHVATPALECHIYSGVEATTTGPVCGHCTNPEYGERYDVVRHASVAHIRQCWQLDREAEAQYLAERAAGA